MEGTREETRLLEERPSLLRSQSEGTPMAHVVRSLGIGRERSGPDRTQRAKRGGNVDCFVLVIGLCSILGTVWLGWRYGNFEGIWSFWQVEDQSTEFEVTRTFSTDRDDPYRVVNISILNKALDSGAVCLDGSPPAYFLDRGSGEGANNWLVFHEGGGWCPNPGNCLGRSYTSLGSSRQMSRHARLGGMLSRSPIANPDFYNWNRVLLKYCDGGSFNGDVSNPVEVGLHTNPLINGKAPVVFFRGQRIWKALMEELMEIGMKDAEKAFLAGCSAGGLATVLHCDQYRDLMPKTTLVKCLSDAGFFLDIPDVSGVQTIEAFYSHVVKVQNMAENLPKYCTSERKAESCLFPEYIIPGLKTPFFMLNPAHDTWQMDNVLVPRAADPNGSWDFCRSTLSFCSDPQLKVIQGFRDSLLQKLQPLLERKEDGAFIDSCYVHCQAQDDITWNGRRSPKIDNKTIATVVGDWYFERNSTKVIDCPYPCNPTCTRF
ncbi:unnamed protein product [Calypogeia fissa]